MAKRNVEVEFSLIDGVSKGLGAINKGLGTVGASLTSVKGLAVQAAAAFGLFQVGKLFTQGVESAATFEQSLDKISAKTGVTGEALQDLGADIRKISQDASKLGAEGAAGFQRLTEEGASATEALAQLPTALDFATASSQEAAAAVGSLSDNLDAFGLGADSFARAADVITAGALRGGTGVADLQKALQAVGPTARDLGLTLEQTTAALGTLAQNGLEGGKAGKALAAVFDQLRDPSSKFREELAKIGITSKDFNTVLTQLAQGGTKTQAALNSLGTQGTNAIKALTQNGGASLAAFNTALQNVEGQTSKTAATINQGLIASFTRLKESADAALATFLQPILAPLADEFDALATQINEFAASPAFEDLKTNFKAAFVEGLEAVKKFIAEFDFAEAQKSINDFLTGTKDNIESFKQSTAQVAAAIRLVGDGISIFFNTLKTLVSGIVAGVTSNLNNLLGTLDFVARKTQGFRDILTAIGGAAKDEAAEGLRDLEAGARDAGKQIDIIAGTTDSATDALAKSVPVLQAVSKQALFAAEAANAMAAAQREEAAQAKAAADAQGEHSTALGKIKTLGDGAVETMKGISEASQKQKDAFQKTRDEIKANIDASKKQAAAVRDVADAADEAAQSMEDFQAATVADAGLSDAIFQGLREGFGRVVTDLALLRGVSEDVIRTELNGSIKGATDSMRGLNEAIKAGDAEIEKLGGSQALAKIRADAQKAADALANMGEAAAQARDRLTDAAASLADELDALNGNQEAIEKRRFDALISNLQEEARIAGGTAKVQLDEAIARANEIHRIKLEQIRAEGKARVDSELGADAAIAASRAGQSATGAPAGGGGGLGAAPSTTDNRTIDNRLIVNAAVLDERTIATLERLQRQRTRDMM